MDTIFKYLYRFKYLHTNINSNGTSRQKNQKTYSSCKYFLGVGIDPMTQRMEVRDAKYGLLC